MGIRALPGFDTGVDTSAPLKTLYHSHDGIVTRLRELADLPQLVAQAQRARHVASAALALFQQDVLQHHADEEGDLFPAVLRSALPGHERELVQALTEMLAAEHRDLEQMWKSLEPTVRAAARGHRCTVDVELLARLVRNYTEHARFEEEHFLPLAQDILQRDANHLSAVGVALHLRRVPDVTGYI